MKELFLKDINPLEDIKQKLRVVLENRKLYPNVSDNIYLALYALILKKDGVLKGIHKENSAIAIDLIRDRLDQEKNLSELKTLVHHYLARFLNTVNESEFFELVTEINSFDKPIFNAHFTEIFDDLLERAAKLQGPYTGEFYQPVELSLLLCSLAGTQENISIFNPFAGVASFNVHFSDSCKYYGQEINGNIWAIGALRICAYDHDFNAIFKQEDSVRNWASDGIRFDLVISNPPFNMKVNPNNGNTSFLSVENHIIQSGLKNLNQNGKIILTVPNGFLFSNKEQNLKRYLVQGDLLETVITFPGGLLMNTSIPFSIIVINLAKKNKGVVSFVDGKGFVGVTSRKALKIQSYQLCSQLYQNRQSEFIRTITNEEIGLQEYNLSVNRYVVKKVIGIRLSEFLGYIKPISAESDKMGIEVKIGDLKSDPVRYQLEAHSINVVDLRKGYNKISKSCILIASKGNKLKPSYFKYKDAPIYVSNDIFCFIVDENKILVDYLIIQLSSVYFADQIESIKNGATIQYFNREDFLNLVIEAPPLNEQSVLVDRFVKEYNFGKLKELGLEKELEAIKIQQKQDLSIKKHNIMQHLNNLKSAADLIQRKSQEGNGVVDLNQIVDRSNGLSLLNIYSGMLGSISNVLYYVDNLTNEIDFHVSEEINLDDLVKDSIAKARKDPDLYKIDYTVDKKSLTLPELEDPETGAPTEIAPFIIFSRIDYYELFNNILENAINHGFTDKTRKYVFRIRLEANLGAGNLTLSFSNNGNAFPKGMAERYSIKGEKAGQYSNRGIGSWKVAEIAKHFNSELIVEDLIDDEFPVNIKLIIPMGTT